jgi:hypothetical protein
LICALAFTMLPAAFAQETTAGIQGTVKDAQGGTIPGATVEVTGPALIGEKKLQTDQSGVYRFVNLPPGVYALTVKASGFRTYKRTGIGLDVGRLPNVDVMMEVGTATELVEVSAEAPIVDTTTSKADVTISEEMIKDVPKTRQFYSLIAFAPGARQEPLQSNGRGNNGFQIDGASDGENTYLIEGMDTTDVQSGGVGQVGQSYNMDFVQEVQIKSSGFEAEFGGATGGVVNLIQKRGSDTWHGSLFTYYRGHQITASDHPYLRLDPNSVPNYKQTVRMGQLPEYYQPRQDQWRTIEAGFTAGGDLLKSRLWLFTGFDPQMYRQRRTVVFANQKNPANNGSRTFNTTDDVYNWQTRIDGSLTRKLHLFGSWVYAYRRNIGTALPLQDSPFGQSNNSSGTDPTTFRQEQGVVRPDSVWTFGGDWTVNSRLIVTARYGYWFYNSRDIGLPSGTRYSYVGTAVGAKSLGGAPVPPAYAQPDGFSNIQSNFKTIFDAYKRKSLSTDVSWFRSFWGTHSFKFGYSNNKLANDLNKGYDTSLVLLYYGQSYTPNGPVGASNCATLLPNPCQGQWGYYTVSDFSNFGHASSYNHSIYGQDSWTLGRGVTLNVGVRFDKEYLPPYTPGAGEVDFGFTDKIAPRLGAAWDVRHNGKWKLYGSYGKFFDIMKYSLPRGSFGGDYWHDCNYTLDDPNYNLVVPARKGDHYCNNGAGGTVPGKLLEEFNWRAVIIDPTNPGVDPNLKPMQQHEFVVGSDYALSPAVGIEVRYVRKRLDYAIEDNGVDVPGAEIYFIGNPGYGIVRDLLQRPVKDSTSIPFVSYPAQCPSCPLEPRAERRYDGLEVRVNKRYGRNWFGQVSYTYSRLYGNYPGLTSTFESDAGGANNLVGAGGGRHDPNNNRSFDLPHMQFTAHGKIFDGPLPTDRPHTLAMIGSYHLKWLGGESTLGLSQVVFSGSPLSTVWPAISSSSAVQFVEDQGNFVKMHRDPATGDFISDGVVHGARTPMFTQTNAEFSHDFKVSKANERLKLGFTFNVLNLLNQHAKMAVVENPFGKRSDHTQPFDASGNPDWLALTKNGWDYIASANGGLGNSKHTFSNLYGLTSLFQSSRAAYVGVRFTF